MFVRMFRDMNRCEYMYVDVHVNVSRCISATVPSVHLKMNGGYRSRNFTSITDEDTNPNIVISFNMHLFRPIHEYKNDFSVNNHGRFIFEQYQKFISKVDSVTNHKPMENSRVDL